MSSDLSRGMDFVYTALLGTAEVLVSDTGFTIALCGTKLTATRVPPLSWHIKLRYMDIITERWTSGERYGEFLHALLSKRPIKPGDNDCDQIVVLYAALVGQWDDVDGKKVQVVPTTTLRKRVVYAPGVTLSVDGREMETRFRALLSIR